MLLSGSGALPQTSLRESPAYKAYLRGDSLFVQKKFPEADAAIDEALRLDPRLVPALTLKAKLAMAANNFEVARQSLERALMVDPTSEYSEFLYGLTAYMSNDLRAALVRFEQARSMNRSDARAALYLGLTSEGLGDTERALACYEDAIRLERSAGAPQAGTLLAAARLLVLLGRETDAGQAIEQAVRVDPGSRDAHFELARALLRRRNPKAAATEGEESLRLRGGDTTDEQIHYLLVRAYRESGRPADSAVHAGALKR